MTNERTQIIQSDDKYGCIYLQCVSIALGAWKWADSREYYRVVYSPYMRPAKTNQLRQGEHVISEGPEHTGDYKGGSWGYQWSKYEQLLETAQQADLKELSL